MLSLTRKTGYSIIAITHLAKLEGSGVASAREIATLFDVPVALLMNVLKQLAAAGYAESVRGARGGYRLLRGLGQISLADLIETMEGPVRLAGCIADPDKSEECTCQVMANCPISDPVHRVQRRLIDFLKKITVAEIVNPLNASSEA